MHCVCPSLLVLPGLSWILLTTAARTTALGLSFRPLPPGASLALAVEPSRLESLHLVLPSPGGPVLGGLIPSLWRMFLH